MLRTAILAELAIECGLLQGDNPWVFVVQHQTEGADLAFERWATGKGWLTTPAAIQLVGLFESSSFRCVKCEQLTDGNLLTGDAQLSCPACDSVAIKRVSSPMLRHVPTSDAEAAAMRETQKLRRETQKLPPLEEGEEAEAIPVPVSHRTHRETTRLYPAEAILVGELQQPDVGVVPVVGKLGSDNFMRFEHELKSLVESGVHRIVLDFSRCDSINSNGLGALLRVAEFLRGRQGRMVVAELSPQLRTILDMFDATSSLDTAPSTPGATRMLRKQQLAQGQQAGAPARGN
ncbi:MAG: STAS domain-containing protein [Planctomycetota bacterium]